ncbi:DUF551 domain-containing protein [Cronobacter dublinensis]|uniref:DUF551 domain-containing protein n=1 Tax=Cronobacter dublinensis TaxID=413497 RepID=UPI001F222849|nr:DUF551 domain-containing protein [Cronobacter dublinensis]
MSKGRAQEIFLGNGPEPTVAEERELARIALDWLALRERAEPVAWTDEQELRDVNERGCGYLFTVNPITPHADPRRIIKLYAEPPAPVAAGWIACSERMPEDGVSVLACCKCGDNFSGIYTMRAAVIRSKNSRKDDSVVHHERVTHWMPLPAAPGKEE